MSVATHVASLLLVPAALAQVLLGRAPLEPLVLSTLVVAGLTAWTAGAGHSLKSWRRTHEHRRPASPDSDRP
jgi:hypothetical protein